MGESPLTGRTALISGGGSGIGRATALTLAAAGASVAIADRTDPEPAQGIVAYRTDLTKGADIDRLFAQLSRGPGLPDILISNAGLGLYERLCEGYPEKWRRLIYTNVVGALRLIRAFVPPMLQRGGDCVFIGSVAARKPHPRGGVYAASKAALESIAETLRLEVQPAVRVITLAPGVVDTPFYRHLLAGEQSVAQMGCGSIDAQQVADTILYALTRPAQLALNHITLRPRGQAF